MLFFSRPAGHPTEPSLIYNFMCEITKFYWQRYVLISTKMAAKFQNVTNEDVRALKDALEYLNK